MILMTTMMNMLIGLLLTVCFSSVTLGASTTSSMTRLPRPQPQPAGYHRELEVSRENYEATERERLHLNQYIPSAPRGGLRVVTFNLHFFRSLYDEQSNVSSVLEDIRNLDADILLLQEAVSSDFHPDRQAFDRALDSMGYLYRHFDIIAGFREGNMIASRLPLRNKASIPLGSNRILVMADVELQDHRLLTIYSCHWEVKSSEIRMSQSHMVLDKIAERNGSDSMYILGADFNAMYDSPEMQNLFEGGRMSVSFDVLGWDRPDYSCWSGNAIDWLLPGNGLQQHVMGTYVYHSVSSDHLPIIMDLSIV